MTCARPSPVFFPVLAFCIYAAGQLAVAISVSRARRVDPARAVALRGRGGVGHYAATVAASLLWVGAQTLTAAASRIHGSLEASCGIAHLWAPLALGHGLWIAHRTHLLARKTAQVCWNTRVASFMRLAPFLQFGIAFCACVLGGIFSASMFQIRSCAGSHEVENRTLRPNQMCVPDDRMGLLVGGSFLAQFYVLWIVTSKRVPYLDPAAEPPSFQKELSLGCLALYGSLATFASFNEWMDFFAIVAAIAAVVSHEFFWWHPPTPPRVPGNHRKVDSLAHSAFLHYCFNNGDTTSRRAVVHIMLCDLNRGARIVNNEAACAVLATISSGDDGELLAHFRELQRVPRLCASSMLLPARTAFCVCSGPVLPHAFSAWGPDFIVLCDYANSTAGTRSADDGPPRLDVSFTAGAWANSLRLLRNRHLDAFHHELMEYAQRQIHNNNSAYGVQHAILQETSYGLGWETTHVF